jgi:hypothetical protein
MANAVQLTGLWKKTSKAGTDLLNGGIDIETAEKILAEARTSKTGKAFVNVFKNTPKKGEKLHEKAPAYQMVMYTSEEIAQGTLPGTDDTAADDFIA